MQEGTDGNALIQAISSIFLESDCNKLLKSKICSIISSGVLLM